MLEFVPFFQIIIGVYLSFCFDKLVQSLFWSDEFTKGLKDFYSEWSTLVWNNGTQNGIDNLQKGIEKSINSYIARTKKLGMFMLVSVVTILLAYCWVGNYKLHNDQLMVTFILWNGAFFCLVFIRRIWKKWIWVFWAYLILLFLSVVTMIMLVKINFVIGHNSKVIIALFSIFCMTFPLVVELIRSKIRSAYFLNYMRCYRDKMSIACSTVLTTVLKGDDSGSKYLLRLRNDYTSKLPDGAVWNKGDFFNTIIQKIIRNSEQRALQLFLEDCRTFKIIKFNLLSKYYVPIDLDKLDSEKDLFRLEFKI